VANANDNHGIKIHDAYEQPEADDRANAQGRPETKYIERNFF
jgi:hypothetical protein